MAERKIAVLNLMAREGFMGWCLSHVKRWRIRHTDLKQQFSSPEEQHV